MEQATAMRRQDRVMTDRSTLQKVLRTARVCRLGLALNGEPYVVPLCFGATDTAIYIHSAPIG